MKLLTLFAVITVASAQAGQGLVLSPGETMTFPIANATPYISLQSTRLELRVHAWTVPSGFTNIASVPGIQVRFASSASNAPLFVTDWLDTFAPGIGNSVSLPVGNWPDFIVRVQRDLVGGNLNVQAWSADGTGQVVTSSLPISAGASDPLPDQGYIGDTLTAGALDYLRWFSTTVPPATSPFNSNTGDLADFEFENTLADSSPQNLTLTDWQASPPAYATSPIYGPLASQGSQRVLHAGTAELLNASGSASLNGSPVLTYQWSQVSGPTPLQFDSLTSVTPTVTGLAFGSYRIQVTVTDSSGQSSSNVLKYGSVFTNANEVVIPPQPYITTILGPMLRLGASPWPYFDTSQQGMADFFGGLQTSAYLDVWDQGQPGTINLTNGGATVIGNGTTFLSTFCGGGAGSNGSTLIVGYPVPGSPGQWGRAPYGVSSCQSDTSLTLSQPYATTASANALSYSVMTNAQVGTWIGGSTNANYYDNVMAFYSLYYRSGIDDYLNYAETLADRWYTMPWFDQGRASLSGSTNLFPRLQSLTGLILRAFDGHPEYWSGIRLYVNSDFSFANSAPQAGYAMTDVREQGYATAFLALAALFDPIPANQALYSSELETVISNVWAVALQPAGNWENTSYGFASWNGSGGLITVTPGSTTVTGINTNWQQSWFSNNNLFWSADPNGVTDGDAISYTATVVAPNQLTLNVPYQGSFASGRGWQSNSLVGVGTQPYMLGIAGRAFNYAYIATGDQRLPGFLTGIESWLANQGYRPDARGLWYGRVFPNCEPISIANANCSGGLPEQSRFLSGEVVGALSAAALLPGNTATTAFGDNLFGAMFGGSTGGPDADPTFVNDIQTGGWAMQNSLAKDFGFFFGFGGGPTWMAARLGAAALPPTAGCTYWLGQNSASLPSAGGPGTIAVNASAGSCAWTASSSVPWITLTGSPGGSGSGVLNYTVAPNTGAPTLTGTLSVAGQIFTLTETGVICSTSLATASGFFNSTGGSGSISVVSSAPGCPWTAVSNASWITVTAGSSGIGNGLVSYSLTPSTGVGIRVGTITVAGKTFTVNEATPGGTDLDIGHPALAGSVVYTNGVFTVSGAGTGIGGTVDHFNFNYWQTTSKETITARLTGLTDTNGSAKAGVMVRQNLNPGSSNAFAFRYPSRLLPKPGPLSREPPSR